VNEPPWLAILKNSTQQNESYVSHLTRNHWDQV